MEFEGEIGLSARHAIRMYASTPVSAVLRRTCLGITPHQMSRGIARRCIGRTSWATSDEEECNHKGSSAARTAASAAACVSTMRSEQFEEFLKIHCLTLFSAREIMPNADGGSCEALYSSDFRVGALVERAQVIMEMENGC